MPELQFSQTIVTEKTGVDLLDFGLLNKGTAFSEEERRAFGLQGLLPPHIVTIEEQVKRVYAAYQHQADEMERYIYLRNLQDRNEVLFYRLLHDHLAEMMPIIYTPVVGAACQLFSEIYRRSRGLFISYPERDQIDAMLENAPLSPVEVIVVTDGERILGLGDQGAGGMGIPIGKLALYTACGGISPHTTLPILLDVGTNNQERLNDPLYIGWRHERIGGQDYYDFLDLFVRAVKRKFPQVLLQFEDFAQTHASPLLERYRDQLCTFNDDIQGTAAVAVGTLLAAVKVGQGKMSDHNIVVFGAGSAGCGIAEQIVRAMAAEGMSESEARSRFYMIDRPGLLHDGLEGLLPFQTKLLQPKEKVAAWASEAGGQVSLLDVVRNAHPGVLIGVSGQPSVFGQEVVQEMARHVDRPIIFPLSNPTSRVEAQPSDLIAWTEGRALIATGSPFEPVSYGGRSYPIAQCNNAYIFPGMGLGIIGAGARRISDGMFMAATEALSRHAPALTDPEGSLLPPISDIPAASLDVAMAVALRAQEEGLAEPGSKEGLKARLDAKHWQPVYPTLVPSNS